MNITRILSYTKHALLVVAMLTIVGISGCDDGEEDKPTKNIWELIEADSNLSMFKDQLTAANFQTTLSTTGSTQLTVFAPSNTAMNNLLLTLFNNTDPALFSQVAPTVIQAVLNYHIVESQNLSASLTNNAELTSKQGEKIKVVVTTTGEKTLDTGATSNAAISEADRKATNGVIHVVETVLVPPTIGDLIVQTLGKVAQPVLLSSSFTTLAAAILKADAGKPANQTILGVLVGAPAVTIFAIPNQVFAAVPGGAVTVDTYTAAQWDAIIRGHIVLENLSTLAAGTKNSINAKVITITTCPATVRGAGNVTAAVPIAGAAVPASNGVLYPIGGILLHP